MGSRFVLGHYLGRLFVGFPYGLPVTPEPYPFGLLWASCGFWWGVGLGSLGWAWVVRARAFGCLLLRAIHDVILLLDAQGV